jgi:hypothetical protein
VRPLLDESLSRQLGRELSGHDITTVAEGFAALVPYAFGAGRASAWFIIGAEAAVLRSSILAWEQQ